MLNSTRMPLKSAAALLLAVSFFVTAYCQKAEAAGGGEVHLRIDRKESSLLQIAVPPFSIAGGDKDNSGAEGASAINFDLKFGSYFKPNENEAFLRQADLRDIQKGAIDYDEWRTLTNNFLVKGSVSQEGENNLALDMKVYDVQSRKPYFSKIYKGPRKSFRAMAHQFSKDFMEMVIGEKGVMRTRIAFIGKSAGKKELFIMDYDGHEQKQVTFDKSMALFPQWNQKNDMIVFTTYRYRNPDLYAIDLRTGVRYPVSRKLGANTTGEWSPDGKKIAYAFSKGLGTNIYICNADGTDPRQITNGGNTINTNPTWSPDGSQIAFTSDRAGMPQIYIMGSDGGNARRVSFRGSYNDGAHWSPKGDQIVFAMGNGTSFDIAVLNMAGNTVSTLTDNGSNHTPSWSPDGKHITFSSTRTALNQIYIMNANGGNLTAVTSMPGGAFSPSWGPDLD